MLSRLYLWLGAALAAVLAVIGLRSQAKRQGKTEAKQEQQAEVLSNVQKAKQIQDETNRAGADAARHKLRERIKRK